MGGQQRASGEHNVAHRPSSPAAPSITRAPRVGSKRHAKMTSPTPSRSSPIYTITATIQACSESLLNARLLLHGSCAYARQLIQATERRTNVTCRWNAVEMIQSAHAIFPSGTTQIRSARHQRARKKGDLNSSVLAGGVEERATHKAKQLVGSLLTLR